MKGAIAVLAILFFMACKNDAPPEGILEREDFKAALLDAQLIEARMNHELVLEQMEAMPAELYYKELFEKHEITEQEFKDTFDYYAERPDELKAIYEEIIAELTLRKDQVAH